MGQNDVEVVNGNKVSLAFPPRRMVKGVADYLLGFVEARMTEICFEEQPLHKVMSPIKVAFVFDPKLPADRIGVDGECGEAKGYTPGGSSSHSSRNRTGGVDTVIFGKWKGGTRKKAARNY